MRPTIDELSGEAYDALARLRTECPVTYVPSLGGWLVTGYDAAVEIMRDADAFTVDDPRFTTAQIVGPSMLSLDGPEHTRHRAPFVAPYRQRALERSLAREIQGRAEELVRGFAPDGHAELRTQLAAPLAAESVLMSLQLSVDTDAALGWYREIVASVTTLSAGSGPLPEAREAFKELLAATKDTTDQQSAILSRARTSLSEQEVAANVAVVMFGAIETTEGAIANLFWHLLTSDALGALRADRTLLTAAMEESLRLEPAAARVDRYATRAVKLAGISIAPGDLVIVSLTAANRDPQVFADPDTFRLDRHNPGAHLTFARGPHTCLGSHLARIEAGAAVNAVLDVLPELEFAALDSVAPKGLVFRKADRIEARWASSM